LKFVGQKKSTQNSQIFPPKNQTCLTKEFYKTIMLWWLGLKTDLSTRVSKYQMRVHQ